MQKYRLVPLTQGQSAIVDLEDFPKVSKYKWCAAWSPSTQSFRAMRREVWKSKKGVWEGRSVLMHRIIVDAKVGEEIDHANGYSLDNRKCNLRKCTGGQNRRNRIPHIPHSSKYKGVSWHKEEKKWRARVYCDKKLVFFARFRTEIEAAKAYDKYAKKFHGEFARTNF